MTICGLKLYGEQNTKALPSVQVVMPAEMLQDTDLIIN